MLCFYCTSMKPSNVVILQHSKCIKWSGTAGPFSGVSGIKPLWFVTVTVVSHDLPQSLQGNDRICQITLGPFPCTLFPIHYSVTILLSDTRLLIAALNHTKKFACDCKATSHVSQARSVTGHSLRYVTSPWNHDVFSELGFKLVAPPSFGNRT